MGGTSLATPMWAAIDRRGRQGRATRGSVRSTVPAKPCPDSTSCRRPISTTSPPGHGIGPSPTYSPGPGYDLATGLGSPVANLLIPQLVYPTQLAFGQQPTSAGAGATLSPAVTVRVEDAAGNVVANDTSSVTVAIGNNPGGGTLGGTLTVAAVNGVATFNNLSINNPGTGYTLVATDTTGNGLLTVAFRGI